MKLTTKLSLAAAFFLSSFAFSQNYLGVHSSNYAGVMGTDIQPASFVDGRFKVDINLASFNFNLYQNAGYFDTKDMPAWWVKSFRSDTAWIKPDSTFADRYVIRNYDESSTKTVGAYQNTQIDLLNFAFHINPKIAVGFAAKMRSITNIDNIDPKLAILAENGLDYSTLWNQTFNEKLATINHLTWQEYGIIYSQVLKDDGEHFMKIGGKLKGLLGTSSGYMYTDNFSYNLKNEDTSFNLSGDFSYGHSDNLEDLANGENLFKSASRFSVGADIGFVYEWRPNWKEYKYDMDGETNLWRRDQEKYKFRVGASVLDIGRMKFVKGNNSRDFSVKSTNPFDLTVFDDAESIEGFNNIIDSLTVNNPEWTASEGTGQSYYMNLPTAFSLQADYHIWKWFYVNATGIVSLQSNKKAHRVRVANQFSLTPSFDYAWFGLGVPVSFNKYSGFKAGLASRLGPITIGVTDFKTLFATGKVNGAEIYAGLRLPILYMHPQDDDNDLVSNKKDACVDVPGVWAFKGCPDTDGDGIQDIEDDCPNTPGLAEFKGCPDTDGDSIPDKDDDCPEIAGLRVFKGCPDTDNDSIPDPKDDCPEVAGLHIFNGCPDTDGDGIKDSDDACPDAAGPVENNGCPDTDGDGLFDFLDDCPTVPGPKENKGCPWPDTDGDGILDKDDKCPYLAGPIKNDGCPYQDTDNDGVLDKDDKCPNTPGPVENEGCPVIEQAEQEILKTAFDNLEFETGKDVIKQASIPSLTELAEVLVKKTDWKLQISGHTDNVGNDQNNLVLSKKRAEAVKNFLISQGVDAKRLNALYFGETMPIATNDTPEGRQKNRRVEMTVVFE